MATVKRRNPPFLEILDAEILRPPYIGGWFSEGFPAGRVCNDC